MAILSSYQSPKRPLWSSLTTNRNDVLLSRKILWFETANRCRDCRCSLAIKNIFRATKSFSDAARGSRPFIDLVLYCHTCVFENTCGATALIVQVEVALPAGPHVLKLCIVKALSGSDTNLKGFKIKVCAWASVCACVWVQVGASGCACGHLFFVFCFFVKFVLLITVVRAVKDSHTISSTGRQKKAGKPKSAWLQLVPEK